jgi:hypothetical protein
MSETFTSKLPDARARFLAAVVEHAIRIGRRTPSDFLRSFPPRALMNALGDQPQLRAKILVATTGQHEKVAAKKSAASAGEDLEIALAEHIATEEAIVSLLEPDDRVRFLDNGRLWAFITEGEFWRITSKDAAVARDHILYILERARMEKLVTPRDIVDGIGIDVLVEALPNEDIARILSAALNEGRAGKPFGDERALAELPAEKILDHVSPAHVWTRVIAQKVSFAAPSSPALDDYGADRLSVELVVEDDDAPPPAPPTKPALADDRESDSGKEKDAALSGVEAMLAEVRGPAKVRDSMSDRLTVPSEVPGVLKQVSAKK